MTLFYTKNKSLTLNDFNQHLKDSLSGWANKFKNINKINEFVKISNTLKSDLWTLDSDVYKGIHNEVYIQIIKPIIESYLTSNNSSDLKLVDDYLNGLRQVYEGYTIEYKKSKTSMNTILPTRENSIRKMVMYKGKSYKKAFEDNTTGAAGKSISQENLEKKSEKW